MTTREALIAAANRAGDHSAARHFEAMTDEQADQVFATFAETGRQLRDAFAPLAEEFAKAAPALRTAIARLDAP